MQVSEETATNLHTSTFSVSLRLDPSRLEVLEF